MIFYFLYKNSEREKNQSYTTLLTKGFLISEVFSTPTYLCYKQTIFIQSYRIKTFIDYLQIPYLFTYRLLIFV